MTRMSRVVFWATELLALSACLSSHSAYLAQLPGSLAAADTNAPANRQRLPGIVEYDATGDVPTLRADAFRQMTNACHGPYHVVKEGPELLDGGRDATATWVIRFLCGADSTASPQR